MAHQLLERPPETTQPAFGAEHTRHSRSRLLIGGLATLAVALGLVLSLVYRPVAPPPAPNAVEVRTTPVSGTPVPVGLDDGALEPFFDTLIPSQLEQMHIPGATVAVVHDGRLAFAKGYGWADVDQRSPVVADRTLFHIGSTSKLFTWTAVMQLVEQGKLDLDADVDTYLDFDVPATYPQPITLKHLMTHTAGFENRDLVPYGWTAPSVDALMPLGQWLPATMPARVRPPGVEAGYSNFGVALAGYIVERTAGIPFEDYVEQHLLAPLDMQRSLVRQTVPPELVADMARGYVFADGAFDDQPLSVYQGAPTGTIRATGTDVAHFMIAHLQDGRYESSRILQPATARQMRQTLFRPDPRLNGMAYGFMEWDRNGQRIVGHIGSVAPLQYSSLALLPDQGVGLFVAYNAGQARPLTLEGRTLAAFTDRFYPTPDQAEASINAVESTNRLDDYTGEYRRNNFEGSYTTFEKIYRVLATSDRRISAAGDGTLQVSLLQGSARFVQTAPDFFSEVGGQDRMLFRRDGDGHVTSALFSEVPEYTYEHLSWAEAPAFNQALLLVCLVMFASTALVGASAWAVGRFKRAVARPDRWSSVARSWAVGVAALNLTFVGAFYFEIASLSAGDFSRLPIVLVLPIISSILSAGVVTFAIIAWQRRWWSVLGRLHYTAVMLAALAFIWFLVNWNLLGFHF